MDTANAELAQHAGVHYSTICVQALKTDSAPCGACRLPPGLAIPRLGIPRLPRGVESAYSRLPRTRLAVASAQSREVALFVGASGSCRRGLHLNDSAF